jgi:hypothetical protein
VTNSGNSRVDQHYGVTICRGRPTALVLLALIGSLGACTKSDLVGGNTIQIKGVQPTDGFLPQADLLAQNTGTLWDLTWMKPGINLASYTDIMIDPVTIVVAADSKLATLPDAQRNDLVNTFYSDIYTAVAASCKVTSRPGPQTVRFHFALSDAISSNAVVKTVATYTPYVGVAYKAASSAFNNGVGYFSGTATAEGYATNGATGELLWQGVDRRGGNSPLLQNTTDNWIDVDNAFKAWSGQLVTKLQQLGVCHKAVAAM